jgi:hypothetical protein
MLLEHFHLLNAKVKLKMKKWTKFIWMNMLQKRASQLLKFKKKIALCSQNMFDRIRYPRLSSVTYVEEEANVSGSSDG